MKRIAVVAALSMFGATAAAAAELAPRHAELSPLVTRPAGDTGVGEKRDTTKSVTRQNREAIDRAAALSGFFFATITTVLLASQFGLGEAKISVKTTGGARNGKRTGRERFRNSPV
jgi:uncharacterized protein YcfJ